MQRVPAIVKANGDRAEVKVSGALDATTPYDLLLVSVLAPQVDAVLPAVAASSARTVMFMFNTFEPFARLREAVGAERFAWGFPAILATLEDAKLTTQIVTRGQVTTVTDAKWADVFTKAGITTEVHADMESWLRTHAAMVVPFMFAAVKAHERKAGITFGEAWNYARALSEGFRVVRKLGNAITPTPMKVLECLPTPTIATLLWVATRSEAIRKTGAAGVNEPNALVDAMNAAAPGALPKLLALRQ